MISRCIKLFLNSVIKYDVLLFQAQWELKHKEIMEFNIVKSSLSSLTILISFVNTHIIRKELQIIKKLVATKCEIKHQKFKKKPDLNVC